MAWHALRLTFQERNDSLQRQHPDVIIVGYHLHRSRNLPSILAHLLIELQYIQPTRDALGICLYLVLETCAERIVNRVLSV